MLVGVRHHCRASKGGGGHRGDSGMGQSEDDTTEPAGRSMKELTSGTRTHTHTLREDSQHLSEIWPHGPEQWGHAPEKKKRICYAGLPRAIGKVDLQALYGDSGQSLRGQSRWKYVQFGVGENRLSFVRTWSACGDVSRNLSIHLGGKWHVDTPWPNSNTFSCTTGTTHKLRR